MANGQWMRRFARWHIWLGWLVGVPMVMWLLSGLLMVITPIEEVRGNHLRIEVEEPTLPPDTDIAVTLPEDPARPVRSVTTAMERGKVVTTITYADDSTERYDAAGKALAPITDVEARMIVREQIKGGDRIASVTGFDADAVPFDFRRPVDVWQVTLEDETRIYVNRQSGAIEAVRTRWWRFFDFLFGLHVMDLETREPGPNPWILVFSTLAVLGATLGCILMFRRRKARVTA
jgi:hypothetical protein